MPSPTSTRCSSSAYSAAAFTFLTFYPRSALMQWKNLGRRALSIGTDLATSKVASSVVSRFGPHRTLGRVGWLCLLIAALLPTVGWLTGYGQNLTIGLGVVAASCGVLLLVINHFIVRAVESLV